jgi:GTPase SAR1 family protein
MESIKLKVILLGDSKVGKSSLIQRLSSPDEDLPNGKDSTIGLDFITKIYKCKELGDITMHIWDTAG